MMSSKVKAIIANDVERSLKNKWFIILNAFLFIAIVCLVNFNGIKKIFNIDTDSSVSNIYVEDNENLVTDSLVDSFKDKGVTVNKTSSVDELKNEDLSDDTLLVKVEKDDVNYIKAEIYSNNKVNADYIDEIDKVLNSAKDTMIAQNKNLTEEEINNVKSNVEVNRVVVNNEGDENLSLFPVITNYIILIVLLLCLNKIANVISQEKLSNSIEYVLTSVSPMEYMIAKILSVCIVVLIQFIYIFVYAIVALMIFVNAKGLNVEGATQTTLSSYITLKNVGHLVLTLCLMCLTIFVEGIIQSLLSAKTRNIQEAGNLTVFLVGLNLVLYFLSSIFVVPGKSKFIAYILSVTPISSMYFLPAMCINGTVNVIQIIIAFILLIAIIPLLLILTQKDFRNSILDFSAKKNNDIEGIEKIISTREYQERMIERKNSSKIGFVIAFSVIILIVLQVLGGIVTSLITDSLTNLSENAQRNIYLLLSIVVFIISTFIPYLIVKPYIVKEDNKKEENGEDNNTIDKKIKEKGSFMQCLKYIIVGIPIMSIIQMICSFAVENIGVGTDISSSLNLYAHTGILSGILIFIEIAVLPAIFEELYVRKGIIGVTKSKGSIFAVVISSLIFATVHMNVSQFIFAFLIGILFGIIRVRTGKLYPTMILHFLNNGFAVISALLYNYTMFMQIFTYIVIGINAVGFCILIYMLYTKFMELKDKESIRKLKERLDYRKIKLNLIENAYVFNSYTFIVAVIFAVTLFVTIEKLLRIM